MRLFSIGYRWTGSFLIVLGLILGQPAISTAASRLTITWSVSSSPAGISCGGDCSQTYTSSTSVTLTATPATGYRFSGWSGGGCSGTGTCTFLINTTTSVIAIFTATPTTNYTLTVAKVGSGTVNSTPAGLVAAYSFGAGTGTTAKDSSGLNNTGTLSGATWTTARRFGAALSFNGVNNFVTVKDAPSLDLTTGMTLEAWVYPTATMRGWRGIIQKETTGKTMYYLHANSANNRPATAILIGTEKKFQGTTQVPVNTWTHLAATYDGATQRLYVNGVQVVSQAQTEPISVSGSPLRIGGNSVWGEYFRGRIDEVRLYNRALTAAHLTTDMNTAVTP